MRGLGGALDKSASVNASFLEDSVQDALLLILERLDQFERRSRFLTWATSIAVRSAMTQLRRKRWKDISLDQYLVGQSERGDIFADTGASKDEDHARTAIVDEMMFTLDNELTNKQRDALLAELQGIPQDEIAKHFGANRNSIYNLTQDTRKRLKQGLEAAGYGAANVQLTFVN